MNADPHDWSDAQFFATLLAFTVALGGGVIGLRYHSLPLQVVGAALIAGFGLPMALLAVEGTAHVCRHIADEIEAATPGWREES